MKLGKAFGTIGALTMVSRVLGFLREMVAARVMGAGPAAEVFALAFLLPNLFRRLFGEGAFSSGFVPLFSKRLNGGNGIEDAKAFAEEVLAVFAPVLMAITALFMIFMPLFIGLLVPDEWAVGDSRMGDAIDLTRITMPYMVLICLVSLASGVVNSLNRFAAAAFAPALLNLFLVAALLLNREGGMVTARAMAIAVIIGGLAQFGLLWLSMAKAGIKLRLRAPKMTPAVKELVVLILPATLAGGIYYLSQVFYAFFATQIPGALVYLGQADRLNQLPLAIIGSALGTAILPAVSRAIDGPDEAEAGRIQGQAIDLGMLLTLPRRDCAGSARQPDSLRAVRGRQDERGRGCQHRARTGDPRLRPACLCVDQGANAGVLRTQGYEDARPDRRRLAHTWGTVKLRPRADDRACRTPA